MVSGILFWWFLSSVFILTIMYYSIPCLVIIWLHRSWLATESIQL